MRTLRFGIEIETVGQTRARVAEAIRSVVGGRVQYVGSPECYDPYEVIAGDGRRWKVMADSSLSASKELQAEVVSPILCYADMDMLQEVVRAVRHAGSRVDWSCGLHVHVDAARFTAKTLRNLTRIVYKQEELIEHALGVSGDRKANYCQGVCPEFLGRLERSRPTDLRGMNAAWYGRYNPSPIHYDRTRYRGLNLHSVWHLGTVEYRFFESTLHAGKVKAYVQFALALSAKALEARSTSAKRRTYNPRSAKYDFRVFLLGLGLIGDEFKTARLHLLSGLPGSSAWKNGQRAQAA